MLIRILSSKSTTTFFASKRSLKNYNLERAFCVFGKLEGIDSTKSSDTRDYLAYALRI